MAFCNNCGAQIQDGKKFCGSCGTAIPAGAAPQRQPQQFQPQPPQYQPPQPQPQYQPPQPQYQQGFKQLGSLAQNAADYTGSIEPADIDKNKAMGGLAYFIFFLPLIVCPESRYGRFHANQGLLYLILCIAGTIMSALISTILTWRLWWLSTLLSLAIWLIVLAVGIIGLINGFSGKAKELPVIGRFRLIK